MAEKQDNHSQVTIWILNESKAKKAEGYFIPLPSPISPRLDMKFQKQCFLFFDNNRLFSHLLPCLNKILTI